MALEIEVAGSMGLGTYLIIIVSVKFEVFAWPPYTDLEVIPMKCASLQVLAYLLDFWKFIFRCYVKQKKNVKTCPLQPPIFENKFRGGICRQWNFN